MKYVLILVAVGAVVWYKFDWKVKTVDQCRQNPYSCVQVTEK